MPFDPRLKSRHTTTLPAALRDELGLPATNAKRDRRRPQLKAIGRPQSAINGSPRGPIKSLRNQDKEQQERRQQHHQQQKQKQKLQSNGNDASAARAGAGGSSSQKRQSREPENKQALKRKHEQQPEKELKVIKKSKKSSPKKEEAEEEEESLPRRTRLNPFTGEVEMVKSSTKMPSASKQTALEKMLAKVEAGPSTSANGKSKATDALGAGKKKSRHRMTQQEKDEEDEIRWLEYSLGKSRQGDDVVRDDLDDFLDDLDRFQVGMYDGSESEDEDETDADESDSGLEEVTASEQEESEEEDSESEADSEDDEQNDLDGLDEEGMYDFDSNDEDDFSNWDAAMATTDEEEDGEDDDEEDHGSDSEGDEEDSEAEEARALIAGSATTITPNASTSSSSTQGAPTTATKYVPPALRAKLAAESSASSSSTPTSVSSGPGVTQVEMDPVTAQKLRRQAQGLLNRLGDANIDTILTEYESLYRTHPRAHVTSTITQLILDTITSRTNLIDTFVILHAALVAALHKIIGVEFAAYFVQRLVEELTKHYTALKKDEGKAGEDEEGRGKECLNLTVLACELYNLHVVACPLVYDLIRMFLGQQEGEQAQGTVDEADIELLLKTIRCCGHQLRSDDSTSLKSIIALTQSRVSSSSSIRTKFMLERMSELQKNAKGAKGGANDASNPNSAAGQLLTRMKKYLGGMAKKRTVRSYEPLRIGLKDLKDAHKKGKWWLVGAAWTGQTDQTDAQGLTKLLPMNARADAIQSSSSSSANAEVDEQQEKLLALARAQGMNTDARRTVFITLLTAEDYKQAAENVLMLKLNDVQRREVIRVLVHCVGSEAVYNPYYTLVAQEICRNHHGMRITLQYCLWDFLREIGEKEVGGEKFAAALFDNNDSSSDGVKLVDARRIANLARAYAWWLTHDCLSLQAFKTVDFTMIQPRPAEFTGLVLIHIILSLHSTSAAKTLHLPTVTKAFNEHRIVKFLTSNLVGGSADLCKGLLFFLNAKLDSRAQKHLVLGQEKDKALKLKMQPLLDTVKQGLRCMVNAVQRIVQQMDGVGADSDALDVDVDESDG